MSHSLLVKLPLDSAKEVAEDVKAKQATNVSPVPSMLASPSSAMRARPASIPIIIRIPGVCLRGGEPFSAAEQQGRGGDRGEGAGEERLRQRRGPLTSPQYWQPVPLPPRTLSLSLFERLHGRTHDVAQAAVSFLSICSRTSCVRPKYSSFFRPPIFLLSS